MGKHVSAEIVKLMIQKGHRVKGSKVLMLGITFKENCPDIRNSRAIDVIEELQDFGCDVIVHDPWADAAEVKKEYGVDLSPMPEDTAHIDAVVLAVAHKEFKEMDFGKINRARTVVYDIKSLLGKDVDGRL